MLKILLESLPFYFFLVDVFDRKWVNRQGSEMEDDVQPKIGLVFITMRAWFPFHLGGKRASECIECSEKFLFLYENFQIDSNNQIC